MKCPLSTVKTRVYQGLSTLRKQLGAADDSAPRELKRLTMTHIADNHEALLDYLYEEGDPAERLTMRKHLQECAACSVAVLEFQNVRGMLGDWTPPAVGARVSHRAGCETAPSATVGHAERAVAGVGVGPHA